MRLYGPCEQVVQGGDDATVPFCGSGVDGRTEPIHAGDVIVVDPGEEHYIYADEATPTINCWFRADDNGNPKQYPDTRTDDGGT